MIVLDEYGSAVFIAEMEFGDKYGGSPSKLDKFITKREGNKVCFEYNYDAEKVRIAKREKDDERTRFVINYLKENYPDTDYADTFEKRNSIKPLNYPTERSRNCPHHSDERHCKNNHDNGCYTCCFVCWNNKCEWSNCIYKDDLI